MAHLGEFGERRPADALGRRIRVAKLVEFLFKLLQLVEETVVLSVRDLGIVVDVIEPVVPFQLGPQCRCA